MRLIDTETIQFEEFFGDIPDYAILSHTWRDSEVLHSELLTPAGKEKTGFKKITYLCRQAKADGYRYAWIDTACIDKTSSAELSEAINSMFRWYENAKVCYVYLDDVEVPSQIGKSRWITRGWTLQELLAPRTVLFYSKSWNYIGSKFSMLETLSDLTGIDPAALQSFSSERFSAAMKMSWAAERRTTRAEDRAYSLLGIFDVHIPILYGERENAFRRLQEEILRGWNDFSLLTCIKPMDSALADNPSGFQTQRDVTGPFDMPWMTDCQKLTSLGLYVTLPLLTEVDRKPYASENEDAFLLYSSQPDVWAVLNCRFRSCLDGWVGVRLKHIKEDQYWISDKLTVIPTEQLQQISSHSICLISWDRASKVIEQDTGISRFRAPILSIKWSLLSDRGFKIIHLDLETLKGSWDPSNCTSEPLNSTGMILRKFGFLHREHNEAFIITAYHYDDYSWLADQAMCAFKVTCNPKSRDPLLWLRQKHIIDGKWEQPTEEEVENWSPEKWKTEGYTLFDAKLAKTGAEVKSVAELSSDVGFSSVSVTLKQVTIMGEAVHIFTVTAE